MQEMVTKIHITAMNVCERQICLERRRSLRGLRLARPNPEDDLESAAWRGSDVLPN